MKSLIKPSLFFLSLFIISGLVISCSTDIEKDLESQESTQPKMLTHEFITYRLNYSNHTAQVTGISFPTFIKINLPEKIETPTGEEFTVTSISDEAFYQSSFIKSVTIPNSISYIGERAFSECSNLESVIINGAGQSIKDYAFSDCENLKSVEIGDMVKSIGRCAFSDCIALNSVKIGHGVKTIGDYAFYGDSNIKTLVLGKSLQYIGFRCFWDTLGTWDTEHTMEHIYCYALTPPEYAYDPNYPVFRANPEKTFLHVVNGLKSVYRDTWIKDLKVHTVNRYPRIVDDLTADGGTIEPSGDYFNMDYKVHTQKIGDSSDVILYQDDDYKFYIHIASGIASFINCEVYRYGTLVQANDDVIRITPTEIVHLNDVNFYTAKYSEDRGYIIRAKVLNTKTFKDEYVYINMYLSDFVGFGGHPQYIHFQRYDYKYLD